MTDSEKTEIFAHLMLIEQILMEKNNININKANKVLDKNRKEIKEQLNLINLQKDEEEIKKRIKGE